MAYFTEILAEGADGYRPLDLDMRDAATLDDLIDMMRSAGEDEAEVGMFEPEADAVWGGDADIYADRDVTADELLEQVSRYQSDPARVVAHIGEKAGFADALGSAG